MRYALFLSLLLVGCGPDLAAERCRAAFAAKQWATTESACSAVADRDELAAEMAAEAIARNSHYGAILAKYDPKTVEAVRAKLPAVMARLDVEDRAIARGEVAASATADAMERQAAAQEAAVRLAEREALRRRWQN